MQCLLVLHAGELHLLLFLKWSIESYLGKWTLTVDLHDVLPVHATAFKTPLIGSSKEVFLCKGLLLKVPCGRVGHPQELGVR